MPHRTLSIQAAVLLGSLAFAGCGSDASSTTGSAPSGAPGSSGKAIASGSAKATTSGSAKPAAPPTSASVATSAAPPFVADPEVVKLIKAIATGCEVGEDDASVRNCKGKEDEALTKYIDDKKPTGLYGTAATVATGEGAKDKKLFAAAVNTFNRLPGDADFMKKNATPSAAVEVAKLIPLVTDNMSSYFSQGGAAVMLLAGRRAELTALLGGDTVKKDVAKNMWTYYLKYGGVDALDDVRGALKSTDKTTKYNAAQAPGVALSASPSDADKTKLCDFAKEIIGAGDDDTIGAAADSLSTCGGAYSDAALDALTKKTAGPKVSSGVINGLYHQCWAHGIVGGKVNGSKEQCEKALDGLIKITEIKDLDADTLSTTLWALGYTGKNGGDDTFKKAKETLAKFANNKDKSVAEKAKADYSK